MGEIDLTPVESIGFTELYLCESYEFGKATEEMVQDSIDALRYDLTINQKTLKDPLQTLIDTMKSGRNYHAPGFVSEAERAQLRCDEILRERQALREKMSVDGY